MARLTKAQLGELGRIAYAYSRRRKTVSEIARLMTVAERTVNRYVKIGKDLAKREMVEALGAGGLIREFAILDEAQVEALDAWHRSKEDKTKTIQSGESVEGKDGQAAPSKKKASKSVEGQVGDPRFLQVVMSVAERKAQMLGTDAPKMARLIKDEETAPQGRTRAKSIDELRALGKDELRRMLSETLRIGEEPPGRS